MSAIPTTDLLSPLVTDDALQTASAGFEATVWAAHGRLREAVRLCGLPLHVTEPYRAHGADRVGLAAAHTEAVASLAALIGSGQQTPAAETTGELGRLRAVARAAGLNLQSDASYPARLADLLWVGALDQASATRVAEMIEAGQTELLQTASALASELLCAGIGAAKVTSEGGGVDVGPLAIADADTLLNLLQPAVPRSATNPGWHQACETLAAEIAGQLHRVTGTPVDVEYAPNCRCCGVQARLVISRLNLPAARALTTRLGRVAA
nr:hypothetical protein OH826_19385 [Streptomyces sp. NBC_00899]